MLAASVEVATSSSPDERLHRAVASLACVVLLCTPLARRGRHRQQPQGVGLAEQIVHESRERLADAERRMRVSGVCASSPCLRISDPVGGGGSTNALSRGGDAVDESIAVVELETDRGVLERGSSHQCAGQSLFGFHTWRAGEMELHGLERSVVPQGLGQCPDPCGLGPAWVALGAWSVTTR